MNVRRLKQTLSQNAMLLTLIGALVASITGMFAISQPALAETTETTFTLAIVPDTQKEVHDDNTLLSNRYQWLADNSVGMNLKFIAHTGDVVDWGVVEPIQFTRARSATDILYNSNIPFAYALGNHDTAAVMEGGSAGPGDVKANLRNTTAFNETFPLSKLLNVSGTFEANKVDNMYQTFSAGGVDWLVLTHEMWPRLTVVNWMKTVAASHPKHNVIVSTHAFLSNDGTFPTTGNYGDQNAQQEWNNFVSQYPNIKLVVSGHYGERNGYPGYAYQERTGVNGNKIPLIMTAYHSPYQNHVRLLSIDTSANTINSSVYVNQSLDNAYPTGYIIDGASNIVATDMNWIRSEVSEPAAPTAPSAVSASAGVSMANVSFTAPFSDGGSPITSYTVTSSTGITASGTTSPITVSGLTPGVSYTFTVTATNAIGTSAASTQSNSVTVLSSYPQLLPDPGFEYGNGGWIAFTSGALSRTSSPVRSGTKALQVRKPSTNITDRIGLTQNSVIKQSVAGTKYTASCYVRPSIKNLNITMRFLEYTQDYSSLISFPSNNMTINSLPTTSWTLVTTTATAVKSGERMIPQIYSTNQYKTSGYIRYDDCSVKVTN